MRRVAGIILCSLVFFSGTDTDELTFSDLKRAIEGIGRLSFKSHLDVVYLEKQALENVIRGIIQNTYSSTLAEKESIFLALFGFTERAHNIKQLRTDLLSESAGGFYNEQTGKMTIWNKLRELNEINSLVLVHELRHALQDQHYGLQNYLGRFSDFDDRQLALLAAVEGDATFIMALFGGYEPEILTAQDPQALISLSPISNASVLEGIPEILRQQLLMPYVSGLDFVRTVFSRKKWKGLKKILEAPPVSSEQVLHPEKYLKGEQPVDIRIGYVPPTFELYHEGVVGEFLIARLLSKGRRSYPGAAGWGGDLFRIYSRERSYVLLWELEWDEEDPAGRFYFDYQRHLESRFGVDFRKGNVKGTPFVAGQSPQGYFFLRRSRKKVFYYRTNERAQMNGFISGGYYD